VPEPGPAHEGSAQAVEETRAGSAAEVLAAATRVALGTGEGVRVRLSDDADAIQVHIDVNRDYPYTTAGLAEALGRNRNFVAGAVRLLHLRDDARYYTPVTNSHGVIVVHKYSELALERLRQELERRPDWNPWAEAYARTTKSGAE
jgi:hypothetical protein